MHQVIDNLVPKSFQNSLESLFNSQTFMWYYLDNIRINNQSIIYKDKNITDAPGLGHVIFDPNSIFPSSPHLDKILPILYFLEDKLKINVHEVKRIRLRKTLQTANHNENKYNPPHIDLNDAEEFYSLVYYVNDSDGDTFLFNNKFTQGDLTFNDDPIILTRVSPKKGRGFFFKGKIFHSGNCPINYKKRIIINFDFTIKH